MASLSTNQDGLFGSLDSLPTIHELGHYPPQDAQQSLPCGLSPSFQQTCCEQQSLPTLSAFNLTAQQPCLPEMPSSPMPPFRPLSEEQRLAFPCLGGPQDCWNIQLCPKHREYRGTTREPVTSTSSPSVLSDSSVSVGSLPTESSSSDSTNDRSGQTKMNRNATDPGRNHNKKPHMCTQAQPRPVGRSLSRGRVPHNLVERRYRDNLNHQIDSLRLMLPSLRDLQPASDSYDDSTNPRIPSKAVIIQTAATYIQDIRNERDRLLDANKALQDQVASLQKLLRSCGEESRGILQYVNAMTLTTSHGI